MREKADEMKFFGRQATCRKSGDECARAGHGFHAEAGGNGGFDDAFAGIADAGTAGVRDQRDFLAAPETFNDFLAALGVPGLVQAALAAYFMASAARDLPAFAAARMPDRPIK